MISINNPNGTGDTIKCSLCSRFVWWQVAVDIKEIYWTRQQWTMTKRFTDSNTVIVWCTDLNRCIEWFTDSNSYQMIHLTSIAWTNDSDLNSDWKIHQLEHKGFLSSVMERFTGRKEERNQMIHWLYSSQKIHMWALDTFIPILILILMPLHPHPLLLSLV